MIVGPNIDHITADFRSGDTVSMVSRINRMTPATSENLTNFLKAFNKFDAFFLMLTDTSGTAIDRLVGVVFVGDADAGLDQVRAGMAWHYLAHAREQSPREGLHNVNGGGH